ncbi:hypothetical protein GCM10027299_46460 [Larkinella ripae]
MAYVFWSLLNCAFLLSFVVICFRATRLVREKMGMLAAAVFVLGLFSFGTHSGAKSSHRSPQAQTWNFSPKGEISPQSTHYSVVALNETGLFHTDLGILFGTQKTTLETVAVEASSTLSGFVSGFQWTATAITLKGPESNCQYGVTGILNWKLLGITVYSEARMYSGETHLKPVALVE